MKPGSCIVNTTSIVAYRSVAGAFVLLPCLLRCLPTFQPQSHPTPSLLCTCSRRGAAKLLVYSATKGAGVRPAALSPYRDALARPLSCACRSSRTDRHMRLDSVPPHPTPRSPAPACLPQMAMTRSLANLGVSKGIRVNAVAPGPIWTPLIPATFPSGLRAAFQLAFAVRLAGCRRGYVAYACIATAAPSLPHAHAHARHTHTPTPTPTHIHTWTYTSSSHR